MTTEQDNQRVSDAYRDIATQTAPADLDEKVLKLAAEAVPSRYGLARAWVRPLAWAATIALSLAFVLEMSQLNDTPEAVVQDEMPEQRALIDERARSDADLMKAKEEQDARHGIAAKHAPAAAPVPAVVEAEAEDMVPLREAEEAVRQQSANAPVEEVVVYDAGTEVEEIQAAASRTNLSYLTAPDDEVFCDTAARATADDWYACIEALRKEGLTAAADGELEALRESFPSFAEDRE